MRPHALALSTVPIQNVGTSWMYFAFQRSLGGYARPIHRRSAPVHRPAMLGVNWMAVDVEHAMLAHIAMQAFLLPVPSVLLALSTAAQPVPPRPTRGAMHAKHVVSASCILHHVNRRRTLSVAHARHVQLAPSNRRHAMEQLTAHVMYVPMEPILQHQAHCSAANALLIITAILQRPLHVPMGPTRCLELLTSANAIALPMRRLDSVACAILVSPRS